MQTDLLALQSHSVATWLLVGWRRHWLLRQVLHAVGIEIPRTQDEAFAIHARFGFMSGLLWDYAGRGACPVRALVASEWPELSKHLLANDQRPEKLAACVQQIQQLKWVGKQRRVTSSADQKEFAKTRQELRRVTTSNRAARKQQESTQRGAWTVCKG